MGDPPWWILALAVALAFLAMLVADYASGRRP